MNQALLLAARADSIPAGNAGLWFIRKHTVGRPTPILRDGKVKLVPAGSYTCLFRMTEGTMHLDPPGICVMEDTPAELRSHLPIMLRASGRVLVTGLGLGCVVRGLLANPTVEHVTCIEQSADVLRLVAPHMPSERLTIVQADALEWTKENSQPFDFAWHDLWTNREEGQPHLDRWHTEMILNLRRTVGRQGAWAMDRSIKRLLGQKQINLIG